MKRIISTLFGVIIAFTLGCKSDPLCDPNPANYSVHPCKTLEADKVLVQCKDQSQFGSDQGRKACDDHGGVDFWLCDCD